MLIVVKVIPHQTAYTKRGINVPLLRAPWTVSVVAAKECWDSTILWLPGRADETAFCFRGCPMNELMSASQECAQDALSPKASGLRLVSTVRTQLGRL